MSTLKVYDMTGRELDGVVVSDELLAEGKGAQAVHDAVVGELAHRRAGTASSLNKGEVSGSGKKPWRQKGTGRARAGYRQSPVWRGGAAAFGPRPRKYGGKINRKVARLALRRAFGDKLAAGEVRVLDQLAIEAPRTKVFAGLLKSLGVTGPVLFVVEAVERNAALACRNIPTVDMVKASDVSVYQLLRFPTVVITRTALGELESRLSAGQKGAA